MTQDTTQHPDNTPDRSENAGTVPVGTPTGHDTAGRQQLDGGPSASKRFLQTIIDTEPECVKLVASDGSLIMMNPAGLSMIQASSLDRVKGQSIYPLILPAYREAFKKLTEAVFQGKRGTLLFEMVGLKGRHLWLDTHAVPLRNEQEEVVALLGITRDVTEQRKTEEAILEQKRFAENLVSSSAVATFVLDPQHKIVIWNKACEELTGKASPDMVGTDDQWKAFYSEKRPTLADLLIDGTVDQGSSLYASLAPSDLIPNGVKAEGWYPQLNGKKRYVVFEAAPVVDQRGRLSVVIETIHDVTERRKAEEVLKQERDFTAAVLDTVGSMVLVLDRDGKIVRFNRTCEEVCGYPFEEVRGKYVWDLLIPPEQVDAVKNVFKNLAAGMFPSRYENYWMAKNGQRKLIAWSNTALLAPDGSVEYVIPTGIDITEQRKAANALLQEKKFSDGIIDSLPGIFLICDETGRLIRWNDNENQVTGYSVEEFSRMNMLDLFREDRTLIASKMVEVFNIGHASFEAKISTKSGVQVTVILTAFRMILNEKRYFVGTGIDISERKRLEDQLRQAQKMESIGTLAGGISHDFNNILTAIIGYGSLMQMRMRADDPLRYNIDQILASANRAANLTQGLLAYSRKQILNPQPVNLNEIIRKVECLLVRLIGEDLELKTILTDKDVMILADAGQLEQVLMNLATNARDAMPEGGRMFIETETLELDEESAKTHESCKPGTYAVIVVTDSGTGMDETTKERIFEPFFTTKEAGKGTGLGLAMAYGIIKQHNGWIEVESEVGKGTAFKIYLPVIHQEISEAHPAELMPIRGGTETILVAEDDETVRTLTCNMLEQFGYTVIRAVDGEDAVNMFMQNREKVQLLLLDVIMPKKNGKEVYEKIRIFQPDMKALFLSGYPADIMGEKGLFDKELDFILKPVPVNDLLRKVRGMLDGA